MKKIEWKKLLLAKNAVALGVLIVVMISATGIVVGYLNDRIALHTYIGGLSLGGLTREEAAVRIQGAVEQLQTSGVRLNIEGTSQVIPIENIGFDLNPDEVIDMAFTQSHTTSPAANMLQQVVSLWRSTHLTAPVHLDGPSLNAELDRIASTVETPRQDIQVAVMGTSVSLLTDTKPGRVIDRDQAAQRITQSLEALRDTPIALELHDDPPIADPASGAAALTDAQKMLSRSLMLQYEDAQFFITRAKIGSWITSTYEGTKLTAGVDKTAVAKYVSGIAKALEISSEPLHVTTADGRVTGFVPPRIGRAVEESELVDLIIAAIMSRADKDTLGDTVTIPIKTTNLALSGLNAIAGVTELIGKAVTTFAGSPKNRISNIKNGAKFISGTIVDPGDEFSTLGTLGAVDDTTGYLPELVIKGNRTTPDFGGGLCQVSTTLFRAILNAGLPVTARRNHSYRVSYYEKDGSGKVIGPGLDATIYEPDLDLKFRNDMTTPVLVISYVIGDKITFELYGTKDGRTSHIDGPTLLSSTPSGDPVYLPTDTLPNGTKKQVETPHPGGSATATYSVTYPDGRTVSQEFKSKYRPWPATYLVGTNVNCTTAAQCAALIATPTLTPSPAQ